MTSALATMEEALGVSQEELYAQLRVTQAEMKHLQASLRGLQETQLQMRMMGQQLAVSERNVQHLETKIRGLEESMEREASRRVFERLAAPVGMLGGLGTSAFGLYQVAQVLGGG